MNKSQAKELFTLITTVRHVERMNTVVGILATEAPDDAGCLLCEGYRHELYSIEESNHLDVSHGFAPHFGCTENEANEIIFHNHIKEGHLTNGENYFQTGKELIEKYGHGDLFETVETGLSFPAIMDQLKQIIEEPVS